MSTNNRQHFGSVIEADMVKYEVSKSKESDLILKIHYSNIIFMLQFDKRIS